MVTGLPVPVKFVDFTKSSDDEANKSAVELLIQAQKDSVERTERHMDVLQSKVVEQAQTIATLEHQIAEAY
jgi:uncharacterized coiled-coil protein SlyX